MTGEISALVASLCWGLSGVLLARANRKAHVLAIGAVRCVTTSLLFWLLLPLSGGMAALRALDARAIVLLAASVVIIVGVGDSIFFVAAQRISMVRAMPLSMTLPLFAFILAAVFLGETISLLIAAGSALILWGAYLLSAGPRTRAALPAERMDVLGVVLALAAALCWAIGNVILTPLSREVNAIVANCIRQPTAALVFLIAMPKPRSFRQLRALTRGEWLTAIGGSVIGGGIGAALNLVALEHAGATVTSVLTATTPLFSTPFAILLLGERARRTDLFGTALTMVGVVLVALG